MNFSLPIEFGFDAICNFTHLCDQHVIGRWIETNRSKY